MKLLAASVLLLTPAMMFWLSVVMYVGLGTDYFFDTVIASLSASWWGNTLIVFAVVVLPQMVIIINGMEYILTKHPLYRKVLLVAAVFMLLGFYAALRKY